MGSSDAYSGDDRGAEASRGRQHSSECGPRTDSSKHTSYAWKVKYGDPDVNEAQVSDLVILLLYYVDAAVPDRQ